ncbi:MAG: nucleotide exchange factor GrpE [Alphaproteobacteria bacterium]|nr:nucleotide exchange factor GrpE [Alphaproteobacteria bacterium]
MTDENQTPDEELGAAEASLEEQLAAKDAEIAELKDKAMRAAAEVENTRRRLERDKQDATAYAVTGFARDLLGVADNLKRALDAIPHDVREDETIKKIVTGVEMTEKELQSIMGRHGIARVESVGHKLDPNKHQAMLEVEHDEHEPGTIVQELQAGYVIKDRLLRPALVSVAKAKADAA